MNDRTIGVRRRRVAAFFLFASDFRLVSCPRLIPAILDEESDYELAACKTLASRNDRPVQPFEYHSVRYWSKEINGTLTGGRKK